MILRILLDECCPPQLAAHLRGFGHDVRHVLEADFGRSDQDHADTAWAEDRMIVSADYDFGELAIRMGAPFRGLVLLGPSLGDIASNAQEIASRIDGLSDQCLGHVVVIEVGSIRRRAL